MAIQFGIYGHTITKPFPASIDGGYPVIYIDGDGCTLCADCANKDDEYSSPTVAADVYYEGPTIQCDGCNCDIESAYGDPEAEEETAD